MDKKKITILLVVSVAIVLAVLNYYGFVKLPGLSSPKPAVKEKTREELVGEYKTKLLAGELKVAAGEIVKVEQGAITIKTRRSDAEFEETLVAVNAKTVFRKIEPPPALPGNGDELTPAIQTAITLSDLAVGDKIMINTDQSGAAVLIDLIK